MPNLCGCRVQETFDMFVNSLMLMLMLMQMPDVMLMLMLMLMPVLMLEINCQRLKGKDNTDIVAS